MFYRLSKGFKTYVSIKEVKEPKLSFSLSVNSGQPNNMTFLQLKECKKDSFNCNILFVGTFLKVSLEHKFTTRTVFKEV